MLLIWKLRYRNRGFVLKKREKGGGEKKERMKTQVNTKTFIITIIIFHNINRKTEGRF